MGDKDKDSEKEKPKPWVTAAKDVASGCTDPNAPCVTQSWRSLQQASKNTKSVHYTPDLSLDEALNKADRFLADVSPGSGSLPSSSMSLRDDTIDENSIPLESSTPNQSIDAEALATGLIRELVSDMGNGEFTHDLME